MRAAVVTLCDENYFRKAIRTIRDLRTVGQWEGDIVLISVGFTPSQDLCESYRVKNVQFSGIPIKSLIDYYKANPLSIATLDARETKKGTQWEKLHVFDMYFRAWDCILFMDAGLRVLDSVHAFFSLTWKGRIMALDDTWNDPIKKFRCQVEMTNNPSAIQALIGEYGSGILDEHYFLNCIWIFDTSLITETTKQEMIDITNKYPVWRTNEMGVMNVFFHFHLRAWTPFPTLTKNGKYLFEWCELNRPNTQWYQYHALKYCATMPERKRIGVAIPCYNKHIPKLLECLASIESQTRKPDLVAISCSSTQPDEFPILPHYSFGVVVSTFSERRNASQNRNSAAKCLDTEIISFFDADDLMHPQRIEALDSTFNEPCDIVLHSFFTADEINIQFPKYDIIRADRNTLKQSRSGCIILDYPGHIHHGHVTVRREIFEAYPFREEKEYETREDCVFCYTICGIPGVRTAYLGYPLSKYVATNSMVAFANGIE